MELSEADPGEVQPGWAQSREEDLGGSLGHVVTGVVSSGDGSNAWCTVQSVFHSNSRLHGKELAHGPRAPPH